MKRLLQRIYWWAVRHVYTVHRAESVDFIDVRTERKPGTEEVLAVLREALNRIGRAGDDYRQLVEGHLHLVAAMGFKRGSVWTGVHGYMTAFGEDERNSHYLACRLVWAAMYLKLMAERASWLPARRAAAAREAARASQLEFVRRFPDADRWTDYILRHEL